ncbi:hydroxyacylglutathione hydrolase [Malassezia psittaci]|uniref:hydroxyacylglutathione hydrolase n=1 Tax=Malassezia psittaci TaxID=1821823 RepID=A0AAF0FAT1_9BASI|nr:hydroxyacylglutathione hydrolase [Malassezia psittaci]
MRVIPVPVRDDNYAYVLMSTPTKQNVRRQAVFVDPYDVAKVRQAAHAEGLADSDIVGLLTTHGHYDHAGGNGAFAREFPKRPIYGGSAEIEGVTTVVRDKEKFTLFEESAPIDVSCFATPCHTQDSICFLVEDRRSDDELAKTPAGLQEGAQGEKKRGVFTGDTLFISGCGRFFEGTAKEMDYALNKQLASLPPDTLVYCGHEYTKSNAAFSAAVLPDRAAVKALVKDLQSQRNKGITTGLYTLEQERAHNPFMLVNDPEVQKIAQKQDPIATMQYLREAKNAGTLRTNI